MRFLRRRLASFALALVVCHTSLVFAAPLSSCCPSTRAAAAEAEKDCCPAGAHAPGQCPRHARSAPASNTCRLQCDAPHGAQFVLGSAGLLPAPVSAIAAPLASPVVALAGAAPQTRSFIPDPPPPRV